MGKYITCLQLHETNKSLCPQFAHASMQNRVICSDRYADMSYIPLMFRHIYEIENGRASYESPFGLLPYRFLIQPQPALLRPASTTFEAGVGMSRSQWVV